MQGISKKNAWRWLLMLMFFAMGLRAIISNRAQIYFDGCGYIMHAWSLATGKLSTPYWMAQLDHYYPPVYPFFIYLFHFLIPSWPDTAKTVSVLFSGLLFLPVFLLARRMFWEEVGLFTCAFLVAYPLLVEVGSNAYSEPVFLFFLGFSMLYGWRMITEKKNLQAFFSGLFLGLAYLTRPQGIVGIASLALILLWFWLFQKRLSLSQFIKFLAMVLIGFYLLALPYDLYNYKKDKVWGLRFRLEFFKKGYQHQRDLEWFIRERTLNKEATSFLTYELARNNSPLEFMWSHPRIYLRWVREDFKLSLVQGFKNHKLASPIISVSIFFLIFGLVRGWEKKLKDRSAHFYLLFWFLPLLIIVPFTVSVLDRYFVPLILCLALWAGAGIEALRRRLTSPDTTKDSGHKPSFWQMGIWLLPLLFLHPHSQIRHLLFDKETYNKKEVEWLKKSLGGEKRKIIMGSEPYPALYSGNYWYMLPIDNINRVINYALKQKPDYLFTDSDFYVWLQAPQDYFDQYLSPFSKPGLSYIAQERFKVKKEGEKIFRTDVLYKVEGSKSFSLKPVNIILVSIDTLRADHLGCYGYYRDTSPHFDRLASQGVRFEKVISQAPKTGPSHMTIFTSLYPEVHGVHKLYVEESFFSLSPIWKTLTEILQNYGYRTAAFTGGGQVGKGFGFERGFEVFEESLSRLNPQSLDPALKWLSSLPPDQPFFLFLHTYQVHDPYAPPSPYNKIYDPNYQGWIIDDHSELVKRAKQKNSSLHNVFWDIGDEYYKGDRLNLGKISARDTEHLIALYDGGIKYTDEVFGRFFEELHKRGILGTSQTLLIITSDHGEEFREHGDFLHKRLYRETIQVPLIFYWPGVLEPGKVIKGQVRLIDLAPTLLDLLGAPIPVQMQGVSLKDGLLKGGDILLSAYSEDPFIHKQYSVRVSNFFYYQKQGESKEELYLTNPDFKEQTDLFLSFNKEMGFLTPKSGQYAYKTMKAFQKAIEHFHFYNDRHKDIFEIIGAEGEKVKLSSEQIEQLKALGYVR